MAPFFPERLMVPQRRFLCRIFVPKDIVPVYGKRLIVRSMRTKDLRVAKAQLPYIIVVAETEFETLRRTRTASPPRITDDTSERAQTHSSRAGESSADSPLRDIIQPIVTRHPNPIGRDAIAAARILLSADQRGAFKRLFSKHRDEGRYFGWTKPCRRINDMYTARWQRPVWQQFH